MSLANDGVECGKVWGVASEQRSRPLHGRRYPGDDRRVRFRVLARIRCHHGVPVDDVGHLLAERIGRQLRPLFGRPVPATSRIPCVVPAQRRGRRRGRRPRWLASTAVRGRRPAAHPRRGRLRSTDHRGRRRLLSGRLRSGTIPAERRLLRTGRILATGRSASRRPRDPSNRRCAWNRKIKRKKIT